MRLVAGEDYVIKELWSRAGAWVTFPDTKALANWRHDWIIQRRTRPQDPHFARCPMPGHGKGEEQRNAALILTYFNPFTFDAEQSDDHVPHMAGLCDPGST